MAAWLRMRNLLCRKSANDAPIQKLLSILVPYLRSKFHIHRTKPVQVRRKKDDWLKKGCMNISETWRRVEPVQQILSTWP